MSAPNEPPEPRRPAWRRVLGAVATAWDITGVTLLLLIVAGALVVAIRAFAPSPLRPSAPPHPYASFDWYPEFERENAASLRMRWDPYVYWQRRPLRARWINVDSAGYRVTPQPVSAAGARREIWFLGGSTMWGTGQRDSATIPAYVAADLAAQGVPGVHVRNLGETGYVFTQEVLRLMLELRAGRHPDVAVFYDGINDAAAVAMDGRCGIPQNESRREMEFAIGRFLTERGRFELREMLRAMMGRTRLEDGVKKLSGTAADGPLLDLEAREVVSCYAATARLVEALAKTYGFGVLYFWQPVPSTEPKPLTAYERVELDSAGMDGLKPYLWGIGRRTGRAVDSAMAGVAPGRFTNLGGMFARDSGAVWVDWIGHVTERANHDIARAILGKVRQQL